jgi:diaminopropionate ammonia-lyase
MGRRRLVRNPLRSDVPAHSIDPAVRVFHQSLPGYTSTPLRQAPRAAAALGVGSVLVKDESHRLGLPSFKVLGASWATYRLLCRRLGRPPQPIVSMPDLAGLLAPHRPLELVAATDGNHGRAVARVAAQLGLTAHILVPADMASARVAALQGEGARVSLIDGGYDDAVMASAALADDRHLVVSDTSWDGYAEVPGWVIDGYATIALEIEEQLAHATMPYPSVIAVQMGVGAFAASMVRHFEGRTRILAVEPTAADCVLASVQAGAVTTIPGPQDSIMAGLNCGAPSLVAWPTVSAGIDVFAAVDDRDAEAAMRLLADDGVAAGESGAAGLAGLLAFRGELELSSRDQVLVVVTEGPTDPSAYERIVDHPAARRAAVAAARHPIMEESA